MSTDRRPLISRRELVRRTAATGVVAAAGTSTVGSLVLGSSRARRGTDAYDRATPIAEVAQAELRVDRARPPLVGRASAAVASTEGPAPSAAMGAPADVLAATEVDVDPFEMIGVRFATGSAPADRVARVRTRLGGVWSAWHDLHVDGEHTPDDHPRDVATSDPLWVGGADGYELELLADVRDLEVLLVRETGAIAGMAQVPTLFSMAPQPEIRPRSAWVARAVGSIPIASTLEVAIIHHTDSSNNYSIDQVPGIIRGVQAYHIDGQGWSDIAYNFMVDKWGNIWEARAGGVAKAVIGGHSNGHNNRTVGICYIGDLVDVSPPPAAVRSISALVAWKLGLHGVDPRGQTRYTDYYGVTKTLNNVSGHRDVRQTACPGRLYGSLGSIRHDARIMQQPFPDIAPDAFYEGAVVWSLLIGLTTGSGNTGLFKPDDPVTRGEMATFVHRVMDRQTPTIANRFPDVPDDAFFATAVRWLDEARLTTGVGSTGQYQPSGLVTRGQVATFLHRMVGAPSVDGSERFSDVPAGAFYAAGVAWMAAHGITTGTAGTDRFSPDAPVTRGELVTFLYRLARTPAAWSGPVPSTVLF